MSSAHQVKPLTRCLYFMKSLLLSLTSFSSCSLAGIVISKLDRVKLVALRAAGTDKIDEQAAKQKGITIKTCPAYE